MTDLTPVEYEPDSLEKLFIHVNEMMDKLYKDIISGEYHFPEYNALSKAKRKEYSLKSYSIILRLVHIWEQDMIGPNEIEESDGSAEDNS